ncbi:dipicolinic acid synthetase subunit A [Gracilibacillus alcaliphilus]|uniref:dipicolinic acid synthetase subunit A n=1 Tax=Gracilibacillus alcaliphilus TaxID=1401441 RepID=UPI00195C17A8|nr:dipicolinic acid synthetase subunit A [Gracilibacillus alcaliphilus]MBM7677985.1 dipicolinate synthase subunit A [Gracilibacillus alcaliphilus]
MDKTKRLAIIGGDARYLPMIHALNREENLHIQLLGFEQVEQSYTQAMKTELTNLNTDQLKGVILPITGIDDEGYVEAVFSDQSIQLTEEWFQSLPEDCVIFTGISNPTLDRYTENANLQLIELMYRDEVAIYNSIPTAEGTVMLAIQHTNVTIHHANVYIFGYGRVGETTANCFAGLGANISVVSKSGADLARVYERGWQGYSMEEAGKYISDCQILINTIPSKVVDASLLQQMNSQSLIIDLASKPGGIDFNYADSIGIKTIHALGLPGMVAPKTAGEILATQVIQLMDDPQ